MAASVWRYRLKCLVTFGLCLLTWPLSLTSLVAFKLFGSEQLFDFSAKLLSLVPAAPGQYLRASFYLVTLERSYSDLVVGFGSFFSHQRAKVGRRVVIGAYSIIGVTDIGADVLIASRVSIVSGKYQHGRRLSTGSANNTPRFDRVAIGSGCWLGEGALVMASVGDGSAVAAGGVVTKPAPSGVIAVGNPARFIKFADFNKVT